MVPTVHELYLEEKPNNIDSVLDKNLVFMNS